MLIDDIPKKNLYYIITEIMNPYVAISTANVLTKIPEKAFNSTCKNHLMLPFDQLKNIPKYIDKTSSWNFKIDFLARVARRHRMSRKWAKVSVARCANRSTWPRSRNETWHRRTYSKTLIPLVSIETVVNHSLDLLFPPPLTK